MAAPPDFAMVREARAKALKLQQVRPKNEHDPQLVLKRQQELRETCALVESKEALLLQLHSAMAVAPRYITVKTESGGSARVVDVVHVVDKFTAFEKLIMERERLLQQRREAITLQEEEVQSLRLTVAAEETRCLLNACPPITRRMYSYC
jgi:hypothetical protein